MPFSIVLTSMKEAIVRQVNTVKAVWRKLSGWTIDRTAGNGNALFNTLYTTRL